ncbi:MAG: YqaE/Pmp3 family membrane protein [Bacteroidota bacterium]
MSILEIILAIFFPPIAVLLRFGLSGKLLVNIILTLLFALPGVIHAFYVLSKDSSRSKVSA